MMIVVLKHVQCQIEFARLGSMSSRNRSKSDISLIESLFDRLRVTFEAILPI